MVCNVYTLLGTILLQHVVCVAVTASNRLQEKHNRTDRQRLVKLHGLIVNCLRVVTVVRWQRLGAIFLQHVVGVAVTAGHGLQEKHKYNRQAELGQWCVTCTSCLVLSLLQHVVDVAITASHGLQER
jgi:hypothetical protein